MNILMINKSDQIGGAAKIAWELKRGLEDGGQTVDLFVADKTSSADHVFALPRSRTRFYLSHLAGTDINFFNSDCLLQTEEFKRADIVHCHNLHGHYFNLQTLVEMSRLKPVVWTLHDLWAVTPYCSQAPGRPLLNGFYGCPISASKSIVKYFNQTYLRARKRKLYRELKANLVAPSAWLKNKLSGSVLAEAPVTLIHHGIDTEIFYPGDKSAARQKLGLPPDKKIVLFVASGGRTNLWKGWSDACKVMADFKNSNDVLFLCIGGRRGGQTKLPNLLFVDYVADGVLADYYRAADAFLLTSAAESFALVVIEAMACGLPVASFPVGIVPEVIKHRVNGYIARDSVDLSAGLAEVLNFTPSASQRLAAANQVLVNQKFTLAAMVNGYIELYRKLLK